MRGPVKFFAGLLWAMAQDYWDELRDKRRRSTLPPPALTCVHNAKLNRRCVKCDSGALDNGPRHDGGKSSNPFGH